MHTTYLIILNICYFILNCSLFYGVLYIKALHKILKSSLRLLNEILNLFRILGNAKAKYFSIFVKVLIWEEEDEGVFKNEKYLNLTAFNAIRYTINRRVFSAIHGFRHCKETNFFFLEIVESFFNKTLFTASFTSSI